MKKVLITIVGLALLISGCKKFVDGDKISPNAPSEVTPALLLSTCQMATNAVYGGGLGRLTSMWMQQSAGNTDQPFIYEKYAIGEGDLDNEWSTIYTSGLINTRKLQNTAGSANPYYQGISKVLEAMLIGVATDLWGDVPYSKALNGENVGDALKPAYDKQEDVIKAIQELLTNAIADLSKPESANTILPGSDDFMFGGDVEQWIKTAWMLKARYEMRISKKDAGAAARALTALNSAYAAGLTNSADDCNMKFGTNANEYNQWYAFCKVEREGYIKMGANMIDMMNASNDPRLSFYAEMVDTNVFLGIPAGKAEEIDYSDFISNIGSYYASPNADLPLITYVEAKFIEAEAKLGVDNAGAAAAHNAAVLEHVLKVTGSAASAAFTAAYASETASSITLEKIMNQKYIAGFTQIEVYNDWRRTNYPTLNKAANAVTSGIPVRMPNSLEERLYNSNATIITDKMVPVWWDAN